MSTFYFVHFPTLVVNGPLPYIQVDLIQVGASTNQLQDKQVQPGALNRRLRDSSRNNWKLTAPRGLQCFRLSNCQENQNRGALPSGVPIARALCYFGSCAQPARRSQYKKISKRCAACPGLKTICEFPTKAEVRKSVIHCNNRWNCPKPVPETRHQKNEARLASIQNACSTGLNARAGPVWTARLVADWLLAH
eukprot:1158720-Pelagomonas_calceolata.AAC.4